MRTAAEIKTLWDLAISLHGQSRYAEAIDCLRPLEADLPADPGLLSALGTVYRDSGDLVHAEQYLRRACASRPGDPAIHFNLAVALLRAGRLREGFREYEWRWQVPQFQEQRREFAQELWRGEPLAGRRILLYGEQGAGDAIQFVRYAPLVRRLGGDVTIEVLPHLQRLMSWMEGGYPIVNALSKDVQFEVRCPLMSLPHRLGTDLDSIPAPARFPIPSEMKSRWAERLRTSRRRVGVVWAANPAYYNNAARSLPGQLFGPLAGIAGIRVWSLQVGLAADQAPDGIESLAEDLGDFGDTAAAISQLDVVITVDTAVAHLAGSLGKPVWLLLMYASDWRWMMDREDTPWYPGMRIFRQRRPGEWGEVVGRVCDSLAVRF